MTSMENLLAIADKAYIEHAPKERDEKEVLAMTERIVNGMSAKGYKFSPIAIKAVREYAKGYALLLSGDMGCGKTFFFHCLHPDIIKLDLNALTSWRQDELLEYLGSVRRNEILVDDIGTATSCGKTYGTTYDILLTILNERIKSKSKVRTHFTTNHNKKELEQVYGERNVDRIMELAKPIVFPKSKTFRVAQPVITNN